jgi:uncharacterized membrane protein
LRTITPWWIAFVGLNTALLAIFVFVGPLSWWAFYSGFLFYVLLVLGLGCSILIGRLVIPRRRGSAT